MTWPPISFRDKNTPFYETNGYLRRYSYEAVWWI